ncbi:hypothetical protein GCM10023340_07950 [Nocardioides marinquilinus]|uniref:Transcription factor WhiB n=1 Tax=Nocardioides marinquilinus TaxID=1210400 RepID=A0ABP9PA09_9ACTN
MTGADPEGSLFACPGCRGTEFEPGFIDDDRQGRIRWLAGPIERGPMGNARKLGRRKASVVAHRCVRCSRLELYASDR